MNRLEVENLSVRFGSNAVLEGLSFAVPEGSALAVIGPNGAGKTVLFKALVGTVPFEGTVRWATGTRIGYVPQKLDVERDLPVTARDLVTAKATVTGADMEETGRALALARFDDALSREPIGALSGGQLQRLLVGVALVGRPNVLMLDEATAGIDEPGQEHLNQTLDRLRLELGLTVLLISHDLSVVYRFATNVLCLGRGHPCFGPPRTTMTPALLDRLYGEPVGYHFHEPPR